MKRFLGLPGLGSLLAKPAPCPAELTLEGPLRHSNDLCHFFDRQPLNVPEPPRSKVDLRHGLQRPFHDLKLLLPCVHFFWVGQRIGNPTCQRLFVLPEALVHWDYQVGAALAPMHQGCVDDDAGEPSRGLGTAFEPAQVAKGG